MLYDGKHWKWWARSFDLTSQNGNVDGRLGSCLAVSRKAPSEGVMVPPQRPNSTNSAAAAAVSAQTALRCHVCRICLYGGTVTLMCGAGWLTVWENGHDGGGRHQSDLLHERLETGGALCWTVRDLVLVLAASPASASAGVFVVVDAWTSALECTAVRSRWPDLPAGDDLARCRSGLHTLHRDNQLDKASLNRPLLHPMPVRRSAHIRGNCFAFAALQTTLRSRAHATTLLYLSSTGVLAPPTWNCPMTRPPAALPTARCGAPARLSLGPPRGQASHGRMDIETRDGLTQHQRVPIWEHRTPSCPLPIIRRRSQSAEGLQEGCICRFCRVS
ncbi:hypothetical protein CC78DRAFT_583255 [Lojkania enalia]|uniref:Uncharacterized protein n=1 Tax=Lojkania enalia TaxID=147567 RepID=A0A9P4K6I9_9PLEO|nr:hypothetical protein CC78DRAFT_583255 [Didymosphaeria enalia]